MTIRFRCKCGKKLKVDNKFSGSTGRCPQCGGVVEIPRVAFDDADANGEVNLEEAISNRPAAPANGTQVGAGNGHNRGVVDETAATEQGDLPSYDEIGGRFDLPDLELGTLPNQTNGAVGSRGPASTSGDNTSPPPLPVNIGGAQVSGGPPELPSGRLSQSLSDAQGVVSPPPPAQPNVGPGSKKGMSVMQILSLVWGILAMVGLLVGLFPCLGWLNWFNVPFSFAGLVMSIVALVTTKVGGKAGSIVGMICCPIAVVVGIIRLILGAGIV